MMSPTPVWLRRYTKLVALATLFLIYAGAMVTSTGSGLAVPDWPLSFGMLMPPMVGGIFYEHGHRMIAGTVGLLTVIQAFWLNAREPKRFVRLLGWTSLGAVVVQGLLGGLTVKLLLPHAVSIAHAGLAEIFFCLNVSIAFFTSQWFVGLRPGEGRVPVQLTTLLPIAVYLQILLGATMRHLQAGLAIPDFPLAFGRIIPPLASTAVAVNFAHRIGATVVTLLIVAVAVRVTGPLRRFAWALLGIVSLQIWLGAKVVWDGAENARNYHSMVGDAAVHHASITSFHVMTGAATLAVSLLLALSARTLAAAQQPATAEAGPLVASEVPA